LGGSFKAGSNSHFVLPQPGSQKELGCRIFGDVNISTIDSPASPPM
jgi:hypothetical protein